MDPQLPARARVALASTSRELADAAHGIVTDLGGNLGAGERIRRARRLRALSLQLTDLAVLVELADGAEWDDVAAALSVDTNEAVRTYAPTWVEWSVPGEPAGGLGAPGEGDLEVTAETLDQWWRRHAEPWAVDPAASPVAAALVDREPPADDR